VREEMLNPHTGAFQTNKEMRCKKDRHGIQELGEKEQKGYRLYKREKKYAKEMGEHSTHFDDLYLAVRETVTGA
jgi:hypothetical protein